MPERPDLIELPISYGVKAYEPISPRPTEYGSKIGSKAYASELLTKTQPAQQLGAGCGLSRSQRPSVTEKIRNGKNVL